MADKKWKDHSLSKKNLEMIDKEGFIVFYDLETTGFSSKNDRIIQFSAIRCRLKDLEEVEKLNLFIKCPFSVPTKITAINHIDDALLEEKGVEEHIAFEKINNFIVPGDIISGYNNESFDDKFLTALYNTYRQTLDINKNIDVYKYAKTVIDPEKLMIKDEKTGKMKPSYKLINVVNHYDPENTYKFHDASDDIAATKFVFRKLLEDSKKHIAEAKEEEEQRKSIPRQKVKVSSLGFYSPSQNIQRVYVNTDQGKYYYDHVKHLWNTKSGNLDSIDAEDMKNQAFSMIGVTNEGDFYKEMRKIKFA